MRSAAAAIGLQRCRDFHNLQPAQRAADNHFARKFHPGGLQSQRANGLGIEGAQAAVKVAYRNLEEESAQEAERWIAKISMNEWHGAGIDSAQESISQDRKSTRLNSSHRTISYAVFCL